MWCYIIFSVMQVENCSQRTTTCATNEFRSHQTRDFWHHIFKQSVLCFLIDLHSCCWIIKCQQNATSYSNDFTRACFFPLLAMCSISTSACGQAGHIRARSVNDMIIRDTCRCWECDAAWPYYRFTSFFTELVCTSKHTLKKKHTLVV